MPSSWLGDTLSSATVRRSCDRDATAAVSRWSRRDAALARVLVGGSGHPRRFVVRRLVDRNAIRLGGPRTEVDRLAALRAERPPW